MRRRLFTSESVTEGHPDKVADRISDTILDAMLAEDPNSRVACETLVTTGLVVVAGEITTETYVEIPELVRDTLTDIGYTRAGLGIDAATCAVLTTIDRQSPDIAQGVNPGGAGDQGMMFGFATDETPERMPAPVQYAHRLTRALAEARRSGRIGWLRPDGKAQVTVEYEDDVPVRIHTVVMSAQHDEGVDQATIRQTLLDEVIRPALPDDLFDPATTKLHINPTGLFVIGGPQGDAGLTGRKIIVDTYGGMGRHGGGAFSGKDATKVDRSAAYAARWAARNLVAAGLARRCEIQIAYAIGVAEPVSVWVDSKGTGTVPDAELSRAVEEVFDLRPSAIIRDLNLTYPIFRPTSAYGHFGREPERAPELELGGAETQVWRFPWERENRTDDLRSVL
ncbi:MAG: methionine adenosyltransferase [Gemmatimonadales bacterium]|nr:MAG: methionine adenosyltransferase [Gemmatimonadales bacterium]